MNKPQDLDDLAATQRRLRTQDYTSALAIKVVPKQYRVGLTWLNAFFQDVAQIPYRVDEPLLGEIRLQWWRDGFPKLLRGENLGHPIADGLAPFIKQLGDPLVQELISILDSYGHEIHKTYPQTCDEFYDVHAARFGALFEASFLLCGLQGQEERKLCQEAGTAISVTQTVADLPKSLHHGMQLLPQDILDQYQLTYEDLKGPQDPKRVKQALEAMASGAQVMSWDIKTRLKKCTKLERALLARWLLVPGLLTKAIDDRAKGATHLSVQNPLKQVFILWRR